MQIETIELEKPVEVYDIGVDSEEHLYTLDNGVLVSNSWSNPADAIRYVAMSRGSGGSVDYERVDGRGDGRSGKVRSNVVDGLAL